MVDEWPFRDTPHGQRPLYELMQLSLHLRQPAAWSFKASLTGRRRRSGVLRITTSTHLRQTQQLLAIDGSIVERWTLCVCMCVLGSCRTEGTYEAYRRVWITALRLSWSHSITDQVPRRPPATTVIWSRGNLPPVFYDRLETALCFVQLSTT